MCLRVSSLAVAALVGTLASGLTIYGQTFASFENNITSFGATWEGDGVVPQNYTATGATDGGSALQINHPGAGAWTIQAILKAGMPLAEAVASSQFMQVDFTTTDIGVAGDGLAPSWREVYLIFNSNQGGWQQTQISLPVASDDGGSYTETLTLDLDTSGIQANAATWAAAGPGEGRYWELFVALQGDNLGPKTGDYNNNGVVDAADYAAWRTLENTATALTNETASPGTIDIEDYNEWKASFGTSYTLTTIMDNFRFVNLGSGSVTSVGVPEPASAILALAAALVCLATRCNRKGLESQA